VRGLSALAAGARAIATTQPRRVVQFCKQPLVILAAITAFAAAVRLYHLGRQSLWLDEAATVAFATMPWPAMKHVLYTRETNMGLYFLFMRAWTALGTTESILRLPSAIASIATIPLLYLTGRRLFGSPIALVAAFFLASNPLSITYAQETRSYSIEVMLVAASWLFFLRTIDRGSAGNLAGWILTTAIAVYAHSLAVLIIPAQLAPLLIVRRQDAPWFRLLAGASLVGLLVLPLVLLLLRGDAGQFDWIARLSWFDAGHELLAMTGAMVFDGSGDAVAAAYGIAVLLGLVGLFTAWRRSRQEAAPYLFAICAVLVPFALTAAISFFKPVLVARYLIICLPMVCLLGAAGCWIIRGGLLHAGLIAAIVLAGLWQQTQLSTTFRRQDWRAAAVNLRFAGMAGDAVAVYYAPNRWALDYYLKRMHIGLGFFDVIYPAWDANFEIDGYYTTDRDAKTMLAVDLMQGISSAADSGHRLWFIIDMKTWGVFPPFGALGNVTKLLYSRYRVVNRKVVHGVGVFLFSWPRPPVEYPVPPRR